MKTSKHLLLTLIVAGVVMPAGAEEAPPQRSQEGQSQSQSEQRATTGDDDDIDDLIVERNKTGTARGSTRDSLGRSSLNSQPTRPSTASPTVPTSPPAPAVPVAPKFQSGETLSEMPTPPRSTSRAGNLLQSDAPLPRSSTGTVTPSSGPWNSIVRVKGSNIANAAFIRVLWYPNDDATQAQSGGITATVRQRMPPDEVEIEIPAGAGGATGSVVRIVAVTDRDAEPVLLRSLHHQRRCSPSQVSASLRNLATITRCAMVC